LGRGPPFLNPQRKPFCLLLEKKGGMFTKRAAKVDVVRRRRKTKVAGEATAVLFRKLKPAPQKYLFGRREGEGGEQKKKGRWEYFARENHPSKHFRGPTSKKRKKLPVRDSAFQGGLL